MDLSKKLLCAGLFTAFVVVAPCASADPSVLDWMKAKIGSLSGGVQTDSHDQAFNGVRPPPSNGTWVQMGTSPDGGALQLVMSVISSARTSIRVASYEFTSKPIARALIQKERDGVDVLVVMDKSQRDQRSSVASALVGAGIPVRIDDRYNIQHSKVMVVDGETVETGSLNYTESAISRNSENVLVVWHHHGIAQQYNTYWQRLWQESTPYR